MLRDVLEGLSNKEIAGRLQISESYVKAILQTLFEKSGVRTRGQLVRAALEHYEDQLEQSDDKRLRFVLPRRTLDR